MKKKKTILVAEDERNLRRALVDMLKLKGFSVIEAADGEEMLEHALKSHPDLILLDLIMPKMDGMTALKNLREDEWGQKTPVIILTNLNATSEQLVENMVTHKPLHYLIKSDWKISDIVKEITRVLEKE